MPDAQKAAPEPTIADVLDDWRAAERSSISAQRAADAAERASAAAERAAAAAERVAEAALTTLTAAQESLDVIRVSATEARTAAAASSTESVGMTERARTAKVAEGASRDRYQQRAGKREAAKDVDAPPPDKQDMSAVGDDGQVFGG